MELFQRVKGWYSGQSKFYQLSLAALFLILLATPIIANLNYTQTDQEHAATPSQAQFGLSHRPSKPVCGAPSQGHAKCHAWVITQDDGVTPLGMTSPVIGALTPYNFHIGYNVPCTPSGTVQANCTTPAVFGPQTIAIIDAYNYQTVEQDLAVYNQQYNLPSCTNLNGCLTVVNQTGGSSLPSTVDGNWALETSLDVEAAHMMCQTCKILLVETNTNSFTDLGTGINTAAHLGATAISNSYGGPEWAGETSYDSYYNHPGIAITVASGDSGYGAFYPSSSPYVISVGGTSLVLNSDSTYNYEEVWNNAGSGCSSYEPSQLWQNNLITWNQTGCGTKRATVDIAADGDPRSGLSVYDSTPYNGAVGWYAVGGTSLSSPLIASMFALAGGVPAGVNAASIPYQYFNSTNSHDVTSGTNGSCGGIMCTAGVGYDGPTGLGTPNGLAGFGGISSAPSPTSVLPTNTPFPTATAIPTPTVGIIDSIAPSVKITSPKNGATLSRTKATSIKVSATDNVGVSQVVVTANGLTICTDIVAPYSCSWTPQASGTYTLTASAFDTSGNTASSQITVTAR